MAKPKTVPIYQSFRAGVLRQQVSGVQARLGDGSEANAATAVWLVKADTLAGVVPQAGDKCKGTNGVWWKIVEVGELTGGEYPLTCEHIEG